MKNYNKGFIHQNFLKKISGGFTLIELLVVIAIIGILSAIVFVVLSDSKNKANDAKIMSQLKNMVNQAQLFTGTIGAAYIVSPTGNVPTAPSVPDGTLFTDNTTGLFDLLSKLPAGTPIYYGWDGYSPATGGLWFVAAGTSTGEVCVDYSGLLRKSTAFPNPTTRANFIVAFPNAKPAGSPPYSCQ